MKKHFRQLVEPGFPLSPTACALLLLLLSLLVFVVESRRKTTFPLWDACLMLAQGLAGCILFVMLFSQHPTTSTNLQLLLLNPLPLFFLPAVVRKRKTAYFRCLLAMIILFFLGGIWQDYAEGMEIVALCLLTRYVKHSTRHEE